MTKQKLRAGNDGAEFLIDVFTVNKSYLPQSPDSTRRLASRKKRDIIAIIPLTEINTLKLSTPLFLSIIEQTMIMVMQKASPIALIINDMSRSILSVLLK